MSQLITKYLSRFAVKHEDFPCMFPACVCVGGGGERDKCELSTIIYHPPVCIFAVNYALNLLFIHVQMYVLKRLGM